MLNTFSCGNVVSIIALVKTGVDNCKTAHCAIEFGIFIPLMVYYYRYFEGGVSSVYLWDLDHGFAGVILIKKAGDGSNKIKGCWDSIHVVEVQVYSVWCNAFADGFAVFNNLQRMRVYIVINVDLPCSYFYHVAIA
jgi:hypothetical protein